MPWNWKSFCRLELMSLSLPWVISMLSNRHATCLSPIRCNFLMSSKRRANYLISVSQSFLSSPNCSISFKVRWQRYKKSVNVLSSSKLNSCLQTSLEWRKVRQMHAPTHNVVTRTQVDSQLWKVHVTPMSIRKRDSVWDVTHLIYLLTEARALYRTAWWKVR